MSPTARQRASEDLAAAFLRWAFSLAKAISIGFRSGEYGGRNRNHALFSFRHRAALALLWTARLSRMTISPVFSVGASWVSMYVSKALVHGTLDHPRRSQAMAAQGSNEGLRVPVAEGCLCLEPLPLAAAPA